MLANKKRESPGLGCRPAIAASSPAKFRRLTSQPQPPLHLRTIYKLADGRLVQFEADRQVTAAEAGKKLELGDGFEVSEPFGEERLFVFAQNAAFEPLSTDVAMLFFAGHGVGDRNGNFFFLTHDAERVKELTNREQTPTTAYPPNVPDFPVSYGM